MSTEQNPAKRLNARIKILDAALSVIRHKGYAATSVEDLCAAAGVTKGAFFHHFRSKEDLAVAAANHWTEVTGALFAGAPYHLPADPLDRVIGYLDFRLALLRGDVPDFTCLVGTMLQETYEDVPEIGQASYRSITSHAATLEADIEAAIRLHAPGSNLSAESLALHTQTVLQGAFVLAKGQGGPGIVIDAIGHLKAYFLFLFKSSREDPQ